MVFLHHNQKTRLEPNRSLRIGRLFADEDVELWTFLAESFLYFLYGFEEWTARTFEERRCGEEIMH